MATNSGKKKRCLTSDSSQMWDEMNLGNTILEWVEIGVHKHVVSVGDRNIVKITHFHKEGNCPEFCKIIDYLRMEDFVNNGIVRLDEYEN